MGWKAQRRRLERQAVEQRQWMVDCGGTEKGYRERYGTISNPDYDRWPEIGYYGNGGEAIFKADWEALQAVEAQLVMLPTLDPLQRTSSTAQITVTVQHDGARSQQEIDTFVEAQIMAGLRAVTNRDREDDGIVSVVGAYRHIGG